jgi:Protein of unknown function (DUF2846)
MTKLLFVLLLASASISTRAQNEKADSAKQSGKVYFMRSTGYTGSAQGFTVFIDDVIKCKLNNKRYSIHEVPTGTRRFSVQFAGKSSKEKAERIEITVEAGKTYYIQLIFQTGLLKNNLYCQEVTESSAKTMLGNLKEDTCE